MKAYPQGFRNTVVQLVRVSDRTVRQVAEEFEISTDAVRRWVKQAEREAVEHNLQGPAGETRRGRGAAAVRG